MNTSHELGALIDERPEEEKLKDFTFEETVAAASIAPVDWREKDIDDLRRFPDQFQDGSGSCVAQTLKKMLGVYIYLKTKVFVALSATHIYKRRRNAPGSGMIGSDAFDIVQEGTTLEAFAPSEKLNDREMDATEITSFMESVGETFAIGNYMKITDVGNIDLIASIIQETGKAVMVWFYFTEEEWEANKRGEYTVPEVMENLSGPGDSRSLRHSVAALEPFLYKGQKALWIEDSSPFAGVSRRIVTEEFFAKRHWYGGHFMNFAFENGEEDDSTEKPQHTFTRDLEFSPVYDEDPEVVILQDILKYEGVFPTNIESTGYFGAITKKAVGDFQIRHGVVIANTDPGFGRVGPLTRAKLNEIYS